MNLVAYYEKNEKNEKKKIRDNKHQLNAASKTKHKVYWEFVFFGYNFGAV